MNRNKSPLDQSATITVFRNVRDNRCPAREPLLKTNVSLRDIERWARDVSAKSKDDLPLLKLGTFGDRKNSNGFYRHDDNLLRIAGVECDYDGEKVSFDLAASLLQDAGIACLIYTTPSHTAEKPRWRILALCSQERAPNERAHYVSRINGVLGGLLSSESFAKSQIFYYGHVRDGLTPRTRLVDGGFIDELSGLDAGAVGTVALGPAGARSDERPSSAQNAERDDTRSGRHFRQAIEAVRYGKLYVDHLRDLDDDLRTYAEERRGKSTKGAHDWQRAVRHVEKQRADLIQQLEDDDEEGKETERDFSGFMTVDEIALQKRPFDFVEGLLYEEQLSVWYGLPKAGKSFLTLDLCCHVANGKAWSGKRVEKRKVLVLPLEGRGTLVDRVRAWEAYYEAKCPIIFRMKPFDIASDDDVAEIVSYVRANKIGLVVFDTLARSTPGTDEDRAKDMGLVVQRFDRIKDAGTHVLIVHHSNKAGTMRGSIAVAGAADLVVNISRNGQQRTARIEANRHGPDGDTCRFTLKQQELDVRDARGNAVISAAVVHEEDWLDDDAPFPMDEDASKSDERHGVKILRKHARNCDLIGPMTRADASRLLRMEGWGPSTDGAFRTAVHRLIKSLTKRGLIKIGEDNTILWRS